MIRFARNPSYPMKPSKIIMTTDWPWLIRMYQGKRRVSSRAKEGTSAYFTEVSNSIAGWISTILYQRKWRFDYVVVTAEGADHGAAYAAELARFAEEEKARLLISAMTPERIAEIQAQRVEARKNRDFARADSLRAELIAAGVDVKDNGVSK